MAHCGDVAVGAGTVWRLSQAARVIAAGAWALRVLAVSRRSGRWRGWCGWRIERWRGCVASVAAGGVAAVGGGASSGGAGGVAVGCDIWQKKLQKKQESASPARIS